jgi:hypothetical protein
VSVQIERPDGSVEVYEDEIVWADDDYEERYGVVGGGPSFHFGRTVYRYEVEPLSEALRVLRDRFSVEDTTNSEGYRRYEVVRQATEDAAYYRPRSGSPSSGTSAVAGLPGASRRSQGLSGEDPDQPGTTGSRRGRDF